MSHLSFKTATAAKTYAKEINNELYEKYKTEKEAGANVRVAPQYKIRYSLEKTKSKKLPKPRKISEIYYGPKKSKASGSKKSKGRPRKQETLVIVQESAPVRQPAPLPKITLAHPLKLPGKK